MDAEHSHDDDCDHRPKEQEDKTRWGHISDDCILFEDVQLTAIRRIIAH